MKKILSFLALLLTVSPAFAQPYKAISLTGYNADVIANGTAGPTSSTSLPGGFSSFDNGGYDLVSQDYNYAGYTPVSGADLPNGGLLSSALTTGLTYQLASYTGNNALWLYPALTSGTLTFATPEAANTVYVLGTSGSGSTTVTITLNFSDASTQSFTGNTYSDWYTTGGDYQNIGRVSTGGQTFNANPNPELFRMALTVSSTNYFKNISSVTVTRTAGTGYLGIVAISMSVPPMMIASVSSLSAFSTQVCSTTSPQTFTLQGVNLASAPGNITGTAPTGFLISSDGVTYGSTATFAYTGVFNTNTVYVEYAPTVAGSNSGNITFSGGSVTSTPVVAVSGTATGLASISGPANVCSGSAITVSETSSGGTWSSSDMLTATVGSSTGIVTGVNAGVVNITYALPCGIYVTTPITVNAQPAAITGATSTVCANSTITLSDASTGGTWAASSSAASVSGGVVTGVSGGSPVISYTLPGGCFVTKMVTVNVNSPISGGTSVCNGATLSLTDATPGGGIWSSSTTSVATVNSSGVVSSVAYGNTVISFTANTTGCVITSTISVTPPPTAYTVTGSGAYCEGGTGVDIGLSNYYGGVTYTVFSGVTIEATVSTTSGGSGPISLGTFGAGTYNVIAAYGTICATNMTGSAVVTTNPLPTAFAVTGGGNYCIGGTGVTVGLLSSAVGINYQLYIAGAAVGSAVAGTGGALNFGLQTTTGTYTVVATNATTLCTANMTGSVIVGTNPLPTAFSVTSSATSYCVGGSGVTIGLSSSATGTTYQLLLSGSPVAGASVAGVTGAAISFGMQANAGTYTVLATNDSTGCTNTMSGSAVISINTLPTAFTINTSGGIGGGSYCAGGTGVSIGLDGSQAGINYQLMRGVTLVGAPVAGTGASISFGLQTTAGSYTVVATNTTTSCTNNMTGSIAVTIAPLPPVSSVTGGGGYCAGGAGVPVGLSGSVSGINYQLFMGASLVGGASGTGIAIGFGNQLAAGTYTIVATNSTTGCVASMSGSAVVVINPLPAIFSVTTAGTGAYCAGGSGVAIGLSGSAAGITYQLFNGTLPLTPTVSGTGVAISFGSKTGAGSYTAVGINASTGCSSNMAGSGFITINPLPTIYTLTGGGAYCVGGTGVNIGLSNSNAGINYRLYNALGAVGAALPGTGSSLSFGLQTTNSLRDSIVASNIVTGCTSVMSGNVAVTVNPLPSAFSVGGGGTYCSGGTGVMVSLGASQSTASYQLLIGGVPTGAPVAGTGSSLSFGMQTSAGTYTVLATNTATGCTNNMVGSATVVINPLPAIFSVIGGGTYCAGSVGEHVGLSGSVSGINYQLYNNSVPVGGLVAGSGLPLDFGIQTAAGSYTVVAVAPVVFCQSNMSGSVSVSVNALPAVYTITQSASSYCAGGSGVNIGLSNSDIGISYQLKNLSAPSGSAMLGTGAPIAFGLKTAAGAYTVTATNSATGCTALMTGTASLAVNALPAAQPVSGGGSFCPGGSGVVVGISGSITGISYQLYNGTTATGAPVTGTGLPVSFGLQVAPGTYTVVGTNTTTTCLNNMAGSVNVAIYPLPLVYNVTGGGNYCVGGTGANVGLGNSASGVLYQLFDASAPMGAPLPGSGAPLDFGPQTTVGTYTVIATNTATGCNTAMFGSAVIGTKPLPAAFNVTGGGNYCAGTSGIAVGIDGSAAGINYNLLIGSVPTGAVVSGTGSAVGFGLQTTTGVYTVNAVNVVTGCTSTMTGTTTVGTNPLPASFTVMGGGNYCIGGAGAAITLSGSDPAAMYQLYRGLVAVGIAIPGTGAMLNFGLQTTTGTYTVVATNTATACSANMTGSVNIGIAPLPAPFVVSGGGNYCAGGAGAHIMLGGSAVGVTYQVYDDSIAVGTGVLGTGSGIDFGAMPGAGNYTVIATSIGSSCMNAMTGSAMVGINPVPAFYTATSSSSSYCAGGTGINVILGGSDLGVSYQLYNGLVAVGSPIEGLGTVLPLGSLTATGTYTVVAKNDVTGCSSTMSPSISVSISPLPIAYSLTGGGQYCAGGSGVHIGLSNSNAGIDYQLYVGGMPAGLPVAGAGGPLDFGLQTIAGLYTAVAVNNTSGCTNNISGSATVTVDALPTAFNVTGGGNYCAGGAGISIGLDGSTVGISYQLMNGTGSTGSPVVGSGTAISFGPQTGAAAYTIKATNLVTGCTNIMMGSAIIGINPLPEAYPLSGGGNFCAGGTGVSVSIGNSAVGVSYQLFNGATPQGLSVDGSGMAINFGLQTIAGAYTVVGMDNATGCSNTMSGFAIVGINPAPQVYNVTGGGNYCAGGAGVHVGLANSANSVIYTASVGGVSSGTLTGTGGPLDFGLQTASGAYSVMGMDAVTGCSATMSGSANVIINPSITPLVSIADGGAGDTLCSGTFTTFTAAAVNGGTAPTYLWTVNGVAVAAGASYGYIPLNGDAVAVTLSSNAACAAPATANSSVTMNVYPKGLPVVSADANPGTEVCQGTVVTYTASSSYGGPSPAYTWLNNGMTIGTTASVSITPDNNDNIYCVMTSDYHCRLANSASSNHIVMTVDPLVAPTVAIAANPGADVGAGDIVTLVATITNAGPAPTIQWLVNGIIVPGVTGPVFTNGSFNNGDSVTCQVTSSGGCAGLTGFNSIIIHIANVGVKAVSLTGSDIILIPNPNNGQFTIKGTLGTHTDDVVGIDVVNMLGQVMFTRQITAHGGTINEHIQLTSKLSNGMYLLNLRSGTENKVFHFVIEQ